MKRRDLVSKLKKMGCVLGKPGQRTIYTVSTTGRASMPF
jgi:hypothetical protein